MVGVGARTGGESGEERDAGAVRRSWGVVVAAARPRTAVGDEAIATGAVLARFVGCCFAKAAPVRPHCPPGALALRGPYHTAAGEDGAGALPEDDSARVGGAATPLALGRDRRGRRSSGKRPYIPLLQCRGRGGRGLGGTVWPLIHHWDSVDSQTGWLPLPAGLQTTAFFLMRRAPLVWVDAAEWTPPQQKDGPVRWWPWIAPRL